MKNSRRRICLALAIFCARGGAMLHAQPATAATNQTLSIGVVIDTHRQQSRVIEFERQVVESLRAIVAGTQANGFVVSYSDHTEVVNDWSAFAIAMNGALDRLTIDTGSDEYKGAVLNDGIVAGLAKFGAGGADHRALIIISEGNDGGSTATFSKLSKDATDRHVQCFGILVAAHRAWVGRVRQYGFDLHRLAARTDGKLYDVRTNPAALDKALKDISRRLCPKCGRQ